MLSLAFRLYGLHIIVFLLIISVSATVPLVLLHAFWIPQIVHNCVTGTTQALRPAYVWGITLTRLWAPLYFKGWPGNVFHVQPSPALVVALAVFLILQAAVLTLQDRWGPGFFVPTVVRFYYCVVVSVVVVVVIVVVVVLAAVVVVVCRVVSFLSAFVYRLIL